MKEFTPLVSVDQILNWFKDKISNKEPVAPATYLDAASKLVVLMEDLDDELITVQILIANLKATMIAEGKSVAHAKILAENTLTWKKMALAKAKKERILELIRIAKIRARQREWGEI